MIKEQEDQLPGQFEVFSFNVDELPDAGASTLKAWVSTGRSCGCPGARRARRIGPTRVNDPVGVLVNAYGHALLAPTLLNAAEQAKLGVRGATVRDAHVESASRRRTLSFAIAVAVDWRCSGHGARW